MCHRKSGKKRINTHDRSNPAKSETQYEKILDAEAPNLTSSREIDRRKTRGQGHSLISADTSHSRIAPSDPRQIFLVAAEEKMAVLSIWKSCLSIPC